MSANPANAKLRVKSYFAPSVEDGMLQARNELGPDALFLNAREAPPEARHLGQLEVVFGVAATSCPTASPAPPGAVDDLRRRMDEIHELVTRMARTPRLPQAVAEVEQSLIDAGIDLDLAQDICFAARERAARHTPMKMR